MFVQWHVIFNLIAYKFVYFFLMLAHTMIFSNVHDFLFINASSICVLYFLIVFFNVVYICPSLNCLFYFIISVMKMDILNGHKFVE